VKRGALNEFDEHEELVAQSLRRIERCNVRMRKTRLNLNLTLKALQQFRGIAEVRKNNFHRLHTIRDGVANAIDGAHSSAPDEPDDLVIPDRLSDVQVVMFRITTKTTRCT